MQFCLRNSRHLEPWGFPLGGSGHRDPISRNPSEQLTSREQEVLALVAAGLTSVAVAKRLGLATRTVDVHIRSAMEKLGARNRLQATGFRGKCCALSATIRADATTRGVAPARQARLRRGPRLDSERSEPVTDRVGDLDRLILEQPMACALDRLDHRLRHELGELGDAWFVLPRPPLAVPSRRGGGPGPTRARGRGERSWVALAGATTAPFRRARGLRSKRSRRSSSRRPRRTASSSSGDQREKYPRAPSSVSSQLAKRNPGCCLQWARTSASVSLGSPGGSM